MKKIILASKSPRRKELLEKCGIPFECMPMNIDESLAEGDTLEEKIRLLSERKADACRVFDTCKYLNLQKCA
jgi:septum formation protein